jgi:hypothetical protein
VRYLPLEERGKPESSNDMIFLDSGVRRNDGDDLQ